MVVYTAKVSKKRALALLLIIAVVVAAVILGVPDKGGAQDAPVAQTAGSIKGVKTNQERIDYLKSLGYTPSDQPCVIQDVLIPEEFDDTYAAYNLLQIECGFDLSGYCGKRVTLYTYDVTGYPDQKDVKADLLI